MVVGKFGCIKPCDSLVRLLVCLGIVVIFLKYSMFVFKPVASYTRIQVNLNEYLKISNEVKFDLL